jgi:hypothetical protein
MHICALTGHAINAIYGVEEWGNGVYAKWRADRNMAAHNPMVANGMLAGGGGQGGSRGKASASVWKTEIRHAVEYNVRRILERDGIRENFLESLKIQLTSYARKEAFARRSPDVAKMWRICIAARNQLRTREGMALDDNQRHALSTAYTVSVVKLWAIVRTMTPGGTSKLRKNNIKVFTEAALGMIRDGIYISPRLREHSVHEGMCISPRLAYHNGHGVMQEPAMQIYGENGKSGSIVICDSDIPQQHKMVKTILNQLRVAVGLGHFPLCQFSLSEWSYEKLPMEAFEL